MPANLTGEEPGDGVILPPPGTLHSNPPSFPDENIRPLQ